MNSTIRTYSELIKLPTFEERLNYLRTRSSLGIETFGSNRYLNQEFYRSREWQQIRNHVIARDDCCDLGIKGRELYHGVTVHHIIPITIEDIERGSSFLLNPEYLITCGSETHKLIHYMTEDYQEIGFVERKPFDTVPWRKAQ